MIPLAALVLAGLAAPAPACTRIVVDPGHDLRANLSTEPIGPGSGRRKIKDGGGAPGEARVNLAIGLELRRVLVRRGYCVTMTRDRQRGTSVGNVARARLANRVGAKLFIRIHADGVDNSAANGTSTLYPAFIRRWTDDVLPASKSAARKVQEELVRALASRDLGLSRRSDLTGFNWSDVPVILVEVGFLSNPRENRLLSSRAYQRRAATGMANGVRRFVKP
jgi:N-acetylmuramoyl-L-alanine amidase